MNRPRNFEDILSKLPDARKSGDEFGTNFPLVEHEEVWYRANGFDLPRRCPFCRRLHRLDNRQGARP